MKDKIEIIIILLIISLGISAIVGVSYLLIQTSIQEPTTYNIVCAAAGIPVSILLIGLMDLVLIGCAVVSFEDDD